MKATATLHHDGTCATVHLAPNIIERIFGVSERDVEVFQLTLNSGRQIWVSAWTGALIADRRVLDALDKAAAAPLRKAVTGSK